MNIDYSEACLRDILLNRLDYKSSEINDTLKELINLSDRGKEILTDYLETGVLPPKEQNGLSLLEMRNQTPPETTDIALIIIYDGIQRKLSEIK